MGGEQSVGCGRGGGKITEVANFEFRDLSCSKEDGSENSGSDVTGIEKEEMNNNEREANCFEGEMDKNKWEDRGKEEDVQEQL